jgi:hypothetical protein
MEDCKPCYDSGSFKSAVLAAINGRYTSKELFNERTENMENYLNSINKRVWFLIALLVTNSVGVAVAAAFMYLKAGV